MSSGTQIGWCDRTWNPTTGCTRKSSGCLHCYAETMTARLAAMGRPEYAGLLDEHGRFNGTLRTLDGRLTEPLHWRKPSRVFVNSMSDLFHPSIPFEFVDKVFAVMALCPQHEFQILTKRPERMAEWSDAVDRLGRITVAMNELCDSTCVHCCQTEPWPLPNVHLGTSIEDQATADGRIPHLLGCPAKVRFLSVEPLIDAVYIYDAVSCPHCERGDQSSVPLPCKCGHLADWVIVGCESGPQRRPCRWEWMASVVRQCKAAGVPVFVKQLACNADGTGKVYKHHPGDPWPVWVPEVLRVQEFPG
ncbi:MAG: phage Gp37/Gp68 family protein [Candidatus Nanopelagicales bacterium]|nr:phage Gp37/Gp68 family protein [Candidatus Nanopelagicales bacterium]